jgi:hypothetical protein
MIFHFAKNKTNLTQKVSSNKAACSMNFFNFITFFFFSLANNTKKKNPRLGDLYSQ